MSALESRKAPEAGTPWAVLTRDNDIYFCDGEPEFWRAADSFPVMVRFTPKNGQYPGRPHLVAFGTVAAIIDRREDA